ncbi:MAG: hypothetical protein HYW91_00830 [Candidatus Sungbacteria bacterium]|nr:hypothetical protein [Candidatus Sungbacteria bacterium]
MVRITQPQKFLMTLVSSILLVGIFIAIFWWLSVNVQGGIEELRRIETEISASEAERKSARAFEELSEARDGDLERIRGFSPNRERPVEFIENLEMAAKDTGNSITLDFDEGRSKTNGRLIFRVTAEGDENGPRNYLKLLELMPYEIRIEDVVFQQITADVSSASSPESSLKPVVSRPTHRLLAVISVKAL